MSCAQAVSDVDGNLTNADTADLPKPAISAAISDSPSLTHASSLESAAKCEACCSSWAITLRYSGPVRSILSAAMYTASRWFENGIICCGYETAAEK